MTPSSQCSTSGSSVQLLAKTNVLDDLISFFPPVNVVDKRFFFVCVANTFSKTAFLLEEKRQNSLVIYTDAVKRLMNEFLAWMVLSLFRITVVLKALETMKMLVLGNLFVGEHSVAILLCWRERQEWDSWDIEFPLSMIFDELGPWVAPAASVLASRNWHWVHCLQSEAHGCGLKVHSWDENAVWNTNSLCALAALFPWLPRPHQASRTKLPPPAHVSTCGLSFYSHPSTHTHTHAHWCHFGGEVQADISGWLSKLFERSCTVKMFYYIVFEFFDDLRK